MAWALVVKGACISKVANWSRLARDSFSARIESVRAIARYDATADIGVAAEILEGEWREIGETATGDKARNKRGVRILRSGISADTVLFWQIT